VTDSKDDVESRRPGGRFTVDPYAAERAQMVARQLRDRGIRDERVLAAMAKVPRDRFVAEASGDTAYGDHPMPIGAGQTISQPYMVAIMTQCLTLKGEERVLEVGTGSGYQAAVLAECAREVYSVERIPALAEAAGAALGELGYSNVHVVVGDGTLGWPEKAPYDAILVTAGAPRVARAWVEQLAEGGRIAVPVGDRYAQTLICGFKRGGRMEEHGVCACVFVPLIGEQGWPE
jgi:protein-L-isoaspartate(D-aspartate) O-methyltransferase